MIISFSFLILLLLILLMLLDIFNCCPVEYPSSCYCIHEDIVCNNSRSVPLFVDRFDNQVYRAINLQKQEIYNVPSAAFSQLRVRRIDLSFNPIGTRLDFNAFAGIEQVLEQLALGNCSLPYLRSGLLMGMHNLRALYLWRNNINTIPSGFFRSSTPSLEELEVWDNKIRQLHPNTFLGLSRLRRLDLDKNSISEIRREMFSHTPKLEALHLGENNIVTLFADTFKDLPNLRLLNLDHNGLKFILPNAFSGLRNLMSLGLQHNKINFIQDLVFRDLRNVVALHLDANDIEYIWTNTFTGLRAVRTLKLDENKIKTLPNGVFRACMRLRKLSLDYNHLRTLHKCIVSRRTRLKRLSLHANPMKCDCSLSWLNDLDINGVTIVGSCHPPGITRTSYLTITNRAVYRDAECQSVNPYCDS